MRSLAKERLAALQRWLSLSSEPQLSPMGKPIGRGPYAVIVPQRLDAPLAGAFEPGALPIAISSELSENVRLAPISLTAPVGQDREADRLAHLLHLARDGRELPPCVWIGLQDASQSLASAQSEAGLGDGLPDLPRLHVALYRLAPADRRALAPLLPYLSSHRDAPGCELEATFGRRAHQWS